MKSFTAILLLALIVATCFTISASADGTKNSVELLTKLRAPQRVSDTASSTREKRQFGGYGGGYGGYGGYGGGYGGYGGGYGGYGGYGGHHHRLHGGGFYG